MSYRLVAAGKLKAEEKVIYERYAKRLGNSLSLIELSDSQAGQLSTKLQRKLPLVALDERGKSLSTTALHDWLEDREYRAEFVIGGADGLPNVIRNQADLILSFGALTWPHQLARVMLAEQLYRVETIRQGHPYHRS